tara:strand:- start:176 stop:289 length:114 start_codon:yes stop_codon:yes gene_type:complete
MTHSLQLTEQGIIDNYAGRSKGPLAHKSNEVYFRENF